MNKAWKIGCLAQALCLLWSAALAEPLALYRVSERTFPADALLPHTFTDRDLPIREDHDRQDGRTLWIYQGATSNPFCSAGPSFPHAAGIQGAFNIYRVDDSRDGHLYLYNLDTMVVIPQESGFDAPRAHEFIAKGLDLLAFLGCDDAEPLYFVTLGAGEGMTKSYKVVYQQTLNGLPLRWSQEALEDMVEKPAQVEGCYAEVIYSDEDGLLQASGAFCNFTPLGSQEGTVSQSEAARLFAQRGLTNPPELCYFLTYEPGGATATLAWRVASAFLSAVNGEWLQLEAK